MTKFLLPGGTGYAGARIVEDLIAQGAERVLITSRTLSETKKNWIAGFGGKVAWQPFDSSQQTELPFSESVDAIINLATPSAPEFSKDGPRCASAALQSAKAAIQYAERYSKRLIHFSSFHVYGSGISGVITEAVTPNPTHPYGHGHLAVEKMILQTPPSVPTFILRPCNAIGRPAHADLGIQTTLIFFDTCLSALKSGEIRLLTDGLGYRDFLPMTDLLQAVSTLLLTDPVPNQVPIFIVANGKSVKLVEIAKMIKEEMLQLYGKEVSISLGEKKDSFTEPFTASTTRLKDRGWKPQGNLQSEINEILKFFSNR